MDLSLFTEKQKEIYTKVQNLEQALTDSVDPSTFVLNPETLRIRKEIDAVRATCYHIYENGFCIICGKEMEDYQ